MISTRLMAPGEFTINLRKPPDWVQQLTQRTYALVLVFPGKVISPAKAGVTAMFEAAWYHGVLVGDDDRNSFHGYGVPYLLKLARQPSDQTISKRPLYDGTSNTSWVRNNVLRIGVSEDQGIQVGPITAAAAASTPKKAGEIKSGQEPLEVLADISRRFGKEWDIRNGYQLEVANRSDLFAVTPTVMATARSHGSDLNLAALEAVKLRRRQDFDEYATTVAVPFTPPDFAYGVAYEVGDTVVAADGTYYEANTAHTSSGTNQPPSSKWDARDPYGVASLGAVPYKSPLSGNAIVARTVVAARNAVTYDDACDIATAQVSRLGQPRQDITLDTETYALNRVVGGIGKVRAGDNIYVFAPELGLVDNTAQVLYAGRPVPAATVRVQGVDTNVDSSMSVAVYSWDGSAFQVDDVTPWVAFEGRGQRVRLGQPRRRRASVTAQALTSPGFGGV